MKSQKVEKVSIFSSIPRPAAVEKLRNLADGPTSPAVIPCGMVASENDEFIGTISTSSSTHIYCKPVKIKDAVKSRNVAESNSQNQSKICDVKVPSNVIAIDVTGQPFSRMASFRRSLIHVDFLIRRKKKRDKRRNTVAEGDALENIDNQFPITNGINSYQQIISESKNAYNAKIHENLQNSIIEQNNNAHNNTTKDNSRNPVDSKIMRDEKIINSEALNIENKIIESEKHSSSKRKPKSHIPISTLSGAMNVAVEMRQSNGKEHLNGIYSSSEWNSDSDNKKYSNSSTNEDGSQDESWTSKGLQEKCRSVANNKVLIEGSKDIEIASSASSEYINPQDIAAGTSTESDTFFISSDEADEDSSEVVYFQENCSSSTSIGTASDGSLNSLLSETGTEMTSSTGTLTSIGREYLLTPPPPPPMILSAAVDYNNIVANCFDCNTENVEAMKNKKSMKAEKHSQKQAKKPSKSDVLFSQNSKTIFASLVNLKGYSKDKNKNKDTVKKRMHKGSHQPLFDMYGINSPIKTKQVPTFIKENISPLIQKQDKSHMKSFLANNQSKLSDSEDINKPKTHIIPPKSIPNVPLKYEHQVTVTPVQRCTDLEQTNVYINQSVAENKHRNISKTSSINTEDHIYRSRTQRPNPPATLHHQERAKLAARVVLDFDGKVIFTTNSLDRKHPNNLNMYSYAKNKSCDPHFRNANTKVNNMLHQENPMQQTFQTSTSAFNSSSLEENVMKNFSCSDKVKEYKYCEDGYVKSNPLKHVYEGFSVPNARNPYNCIPENLSRFVPKKTDIRPFSYAGPISSDSYYNSSSNIFEPNPNISGLPMQETMLTRHNVNLHSKQMEKINICSEDSFNIISGNFCVTPPSKTNILHKSPQSTISTEDLFTVIHNCKKRMNIKTDSNISLASSSRSSSPSYLRSSSSKGTLVETGFLSPRSQAHLETSGDRRSWADFRPIDSICHERKSLASDRLGPTKPTSMHDFKMLLLQARANSQTSRQRKSAVEMLKLPLNHNKRDEILSPPLNLSPITLSAQNSPTVEQGIVNGHSTVPFKRGSRVRSLQSRYIIYPPIFEDCSEDLETCTELISKPATGTTNKDDQDNSNNNKKFSHNHQKFSHDN